MKTQIDSSIIKEYYKPFYHEYKEDSKQLHSKIIPKEVIFLDIALRSKNIYTLISNHYSTTTNTMTEIAEAIDLIENSTKCNQNNLHFSINPFTNTDDNDSDSDSDDEPISIFKLSSIIIENKETIQRLEAKLIEKQSKIPKITYKLTQLNDQLTEEIKSMNALISIFDPPSNEDLRHENYSIILNIIKDIYAKSNRQLMTALDFSKENIKCLAKEIGSHMAMISIEDRRGIKKKLLEIKQTMKNNGSFYSRLYEIIIGQYDIVSLNQKIKKGDEDLIKTQKTIDEIKAQIDKLNKKNVMFDQTKGVIKKKYSNKKKSNSKDTNNTKTSQHQEEIDRLKLLIYNLDKNYVELLKQLSSKIISPKDLFKN